MHRKVMSRLRKKVVSRMDKNKILFNSLYGKYGKRIFDKKYPLSEGNFYCKSCGQMKPIKQKIESFETINGKKLLTKVECIDCYEIRMCV